MELHGFCYAFFGGADLSLLNEGTLDGWEQVTHEKFAYDGMDGKGGGESAIFRKIAKQLTDNDRQRLRSFGEPKKGWVAPLGWLETGRPWLTCTKDGRIKIDMKAADALRRERFTYGDGADHPHAIAASAVVLVLNALDEKKLDQS